MPPGGADEDERLLHELLLATGLPIDLAAALPAAALLHPLTELGVRKVGHRQRLLARLHAKAAIATSPPTHQPAPATTHHAAAGTTSNASTAIPTAASNAPTATPTAIPTAASNAPTAIPRKLFTFWFDGHSSDLNPRAPRERAAADAELVTCCHSLMAVTHPHWRFRVLRLGDPDLPPPPVAVEGLSGAQLADWYRLCALYEYGGVYLDATCVTLGCVEHWVDLDDGSIQGWLYVSDLETMESWAIAAPPRHPFVCKWRDEFGAALVAGVAAYCHALPREVVTPGLRPAIEHGYLAIHAAWRVARSALPHTHFNLRSPVESGGPYRYLAEGSWASGKAVGSLFAKSEEELRSTALIKLRGRERDSIQPLASYGRSSALARALLGATTPATVTERMAFVRCGLDPDEPPRAPW